ncbi:glycosyltransferase family 2 protein [Thermosynechococcus sp. QKsg1]|uniref:glycosyltransferase family 2 protein n=1 Tax=Thermosynechococcus sp. QKsg1 TaxID=3074130 RepID=UPI0028773EB7|nr:glycosyltransferase family 2 protein [Thermosynechococcus sp. QKsg1]WNC85999.1 glycosyltransferase family 2 protein [Thermosynechococcus sp. QKsg1]
MPKVSIGMPVYNGAKFIREALDSLLAQTFTDFELIISDNASTDETEAICREYAAKDKRIRYVRQAQNLGAMANFKYVLDEARGEYFMWAAHDDLWESDYLMNATSILKDISLSFVFPSFALASIRFPIKKYIRGSIYKFIEYSDSRKRVLEFLLLHHLSHKCNIVYSLFRADFLRSAYSIQDISNDGILGAVLLSRGRGGLLSKPCFIKRYETLWPGALTYVFKYVFRCLNITCSTEFEYNKSISTDKLCNLLPQYKKEIKLIFDQYREYDYQKDFKICSIDVVDGSVGHNNA